MQPVRPALAARRASINVDGIEATANICGGDPRIARTRIPVWTLAQSRSLGMSETQILDAYPSLTAVDLVHAWESTEAHPDQISQQITENEEA